MICSQVASLADASCVEFAVCMLTECSHLVTPFTVVAILAHTRCVIDAVNVRTLGNLVPMFHFFTICIFGFFQSRLSLFLLFICRFAHPFLGLFHRHDDLSIWRYKGVFFVVLVSFWLGNGDERSGNLELNCYRRRFLLLVWWVFRIRVRLFLFKRSHGRRRPDLEFILWLLERRNVWFTDN